MLVTFLQKRGQELDFAMQAFGVPRVSDSPTAVMGTRGGVCGARTHVPPGVWEGEHGEKRKLPSVMSRDGAVRDVMQMALLLSLSLSLKKKGDAIACAGWMPLRDAIDPIMPHYP